MGSGCTDAAAYEASIIQANGLFDLANTLGISMTLLDIGGGFPSPNDQDVSFAEVRCPVSGFMC